MKIYEQREKYKKTVHCRVCGNEGHLWITCDVPAKMMELKKQGKEPDTSLYSAWQQSSCGKRDSNGKLVYQDHIWSKMSRELDRQNRRKDNRKEKKACKERLYGKPTKRKVSCGFCGETGHNRRNCTIMKDFVSDLSLANQNYRKRFYNKIVRQTGVCEGALVQLAAKHVFVNASWEENWEGIGIITKVDWASVNVGLSHQQWDWKTSFTIEVLVDGDIIVVEKPMGKLVDDDGIKGEIWNLFGGNGGGFSPWITEIIAPSKTKPSQEWFNQGYDDCWVWLTKKYTLGQLKTYLLPTISKWHPAQTGSAEAKLKNRIKTYGEYNG